MIDMANAASRAKRFLYSGLRFATSGNMTLHAYSLPVFGSRMR